MIERHFTVTTYILDKGKTLLLFHPKHQKWTPPGGHLEVNETPPECAKREVLEETGLEIEFIKQENLWINGANASSMERPYLCLLENIPPHGIHAAHQHMDLLYLARPVGGKEREDLVQKNLLRWWSYEELLLIPDQLIFGDVKQTLEHLNFLQV